MSTRSAKRKDPVAAELATLRSELLEEICELRALLLHRLPAPAPVDAADTVGVVEGARLALRSPATLRRGAPLGWYDDVTGRYLVSRRGMRDYFVGRFGKAPPGLA